MQQRFHLGKDLLDGVKVQAVGRQVEQPHSGIFEALSNAGDFVGGQAVAHDDAAGVHFGNKVVGESLLEDEAGHPAQVPREYTVPNRQACRRGGMNTKWHAVADTNGRSMSFVMIA